MKDETKLQIIGYIRQGFGIKKISNILNVLEKEILSFIKIYFQDGF